MDLYTWITNNLPIVIALGCMVVLVIFMKKSGL